MIEFEQPNDRQIMLYRTADGAAGPKPSMGLTTWKGAPHGKILKSDVSVAKHYLVGREIKRIQGKSRSDDADPPGQGAIP